MLGGSACPGFAWDPLVTLFGKSVTLLEPEKQPVKLGVGRWLNPFLRISQGQPEALMCGQDYAKPAQLRHMVAISTHPFAILLLRGRLKVPCIAKEESGFWTLTSSELLVCRGDRHMTNNHTQGDGITLIRIVDVASEKEDFVRPCNRETGPVLGLLEDCPEAQR